MNQLLHNTWFWVYAGTFVLSAIVSNMPAPDDKSGAGYKWAYGTLHTLVGNIGNLISMAKNPSSSQKVTQ